RVPMSSRPPTRTARTRIKTSCGPGRGAGTSSIRSTSGGPNSWMTAAFMSVSPPSRGGPGAGQRRPCVEELVSGNPGSPEVREAVVGHRPTARPIARLVVDLDQVRVVLDETACRVKVVGEEVAAGAVAPRPPQEAAFVLLEDVAELAENREVLHLPRVVVEPLPALRDADSVMVSVAAQEEQRPVADV